jgi:tetratricopeptide (TPR) repeat protein
MMYVLNERMGSALGALRRLQAADKNGEFFDAEARTRLAAMEETVQEEAAQLKVPLATFEAAMVLMEQGEAACQDDDYEAGFTLLRRAAELVPGWSIPVLNLSVFQFESGQAEEAIASVEEVVNKLEAEGFSGLAHLITISVWAGQPERARTLLPRLVTAFEKEATRIEALQTEEDREGAELLYYKVAGTFAVFEEDENVYATLKRGEKAGIEYSADAWRWLAVSAYNMGKYDEASAYWQKYGPSEQTPFDMGLQEAIARPRPADAPPLRLPYFESSSYLPLPVMSKLLVMKLDDADDSEDAEPTFEFDTEQVQKAYYELSKFYPIQRALLQNANFGVQAVAETNVGILSEIHTPDVAAALKDFAQGYIGPEMARRYAVAILVDWDVLPDEGQLRFWLEQPGEWQDLPMSSFASLEEEETRILDDASELIDEDD